MKLGHCSDTSCRLLLPRAFRAQRGVCGRAWVGFALQATIRLFFSFNSFWIILMGIRRRRAHQRIVQGRSDNDDYLNSFSKADKDASAEDSRALFVRFAIAFAALLFLGGFLLMIMQKSLKGKWERCAPAVSASLIHESKHQAFSSETIRNVQVVSRNWHFRMYMVGRISWMWLEDILYGALSSGVNVCPIHKHRSLLRGSLLIVSCYSQDLFVPKAFPADIAIFC